MVVQTAQGSCGISILGGVEDSTGQDLGQPAVSDPALSMGLD